MRDGESGDEALCFRFWSKIGKRPHFPLDPLKLRRKYHGSHAFVLLLRTIDEMQVVDSLEHHQSLERRYAIENIPNAIEGDRHVAIAGYHERRHVAIPSEVERCRNYTRAWIGGSGRCQSYERLDATDLRRCGERGPSTEAVPDNPDPLPGFTNNFQEKLNIRHAGLDQRTQPRVLLLRIGSIAWSRQSMVGMIQRSDRIAMAREMLAQETRRRLRASAEVREQNQNAGRFANGIPRRAAKFPAAPSIVGYELPSFDVIRTACKRIVRLEARHSQSRFCEPRPSPRLESKCRIAIYLIQRG